MKHIPFNEGWKFQRCDEEGEGVPVHIPHDAMLSENRTENSAGGTNSGWYEGRDYRYTKKFFVPVEYREQEILIEFEGVYRNADVYLNGRKAANRPYGFTNFYVDCEGFLEYGSENEIVVIARNADQPNCRWYSGAGIYRDVTMHIGSKAGHIRINGLRVRTLSIEPAKIEVEIVTVGSGSGELVILRKEREVLRRSFVSAGKRVLWLDVPDADLWDPAHPNLYTAKAEFLGDEECIAFGIRTVEISRTKGFLLNGKRTVLRGACVHGDNGILGARSEYEAEERRVRILKGVGYNALRSAHNPASKHFLTACDRLGMLVMDEYADSWYIHKTQYDYADYLTEWWKQDLKDMVEKDYNHPCVVLYSTGNEVSETAQKRGIELVGEMTDYLHELGSTRPVTCGVNIFFNFLSSLGFGVYSDKKAEKNSKKSYKKKKAVGSEFFNNLAGLFGDRVMKIGATLHGCDVKTRSAFAKMDVAGYNYGILRYRHDLKKYPDRIIVGSETFCNDAYKFIELSKRHPRLIGDFVWAGMDYLGEVGIGAWEYCDYAPKFDHGPGWVSAGSGRVDLTGNLLGEAAYTKVAFGLTKKPAIAVRPVNNTGKKHSPSAWKMTNALLSWAWNGCEGKKAIIEVYARAAKVELLMNGRSLGKKKPKKAIAIFSARYEPGELTAVSFDKKGREIARSSLVSTDEKTVLSAQAEQSAVPAGKLCFVNLRYTDEKGIVKMLERNQISVTVTGGELVALGNACPYNAEGYGNSVTSTYFGQALAIVRAGKSGTLRIEASDTERTAATTVEILK